AVVPVMVLVMLVILMIQLQSTQKLTMVMLTAPLGLIGISLALLSSHRPFGFVAMLGAFALTGMIIRNSVVLIAQIKDNEDAGMRRLAGARGDGRVDDAPAAPDLVDGRRVDPRPDPDRRRGVLGPDGRRDDGRAPDRDRAHADFPARALRRVVRRARHARRSASGFESFLPQHSPLEYLGEHRWISTFS